MAVTDVSDLLPPILKTWLSGYTRRIFDAGIRAGQAVERRNHDTGAIDIRDAHRSADLAFEELYAALCAKMRRK